MDRLRNPELYYEELRLLEEVRLNNIDAVTRTGRLSAHGSEIREFLTLRSSLEKLVGEKDAQVGKIVEEIKQEMKKAGYVMAEQ
jgi:UV DNA damage repair endonuclease